MNLFKPVVIGLLFSVTFWAQDNKLKTLQEKVDSGDEHAIYELAEALYWADGVDRDLEQSANYALVATLKGNPLAQYRHAVQLLLGQGVEQDVKAGFELLEKAIPGLQQLSEKQNPDALYKTGKLYQLGLIKSNHFNPDDKMALSNFRASAALGHARAGYMAGQMMRLGLGIPKNDIKALKLLKESADSGLSMAGLHVWILHTVAGGNIVSQAEALKYLKLAATSGLREAQFLYGNALGEGKLGLKADKIAALPWLKKAAKQGDDRAQLLLGLLYADDSEEAAVKDNYEESFIWLTLSTRAESKLTRENARKNLEKVRKQIEPIMQLDLIKQVNAFKVIKTRATINALMGLEGADNSIRQSLRLDNLTSAAGSGDSEAMFMLGMFYLDQREYKQSEQWLKKSAKEGFVAAMEAIGQKYVSGGFGGEPDYQQGSHWLKRAAKNNSLEAMTSLGIMALSDNLPGSKPDEAIEWFRKGAEKGYAPAQMRLGGSLYEGDVVKQDIKGAMEWMHKAAAQHYRPAEGSMAIMYAEGKLDGPNYDEAFEWARRGAMQGDALSQRLLGFLYLQNKGVLPSKLPKRVDHKRYAFKWLTLAKNGGIPDLEPALNLLQKEMESVDIKRALIEASQFKAEYRYLPDKKYASVKEVNLDMLIKEANQGKAKSQVELARLFSQGEGVKPDPIESYKWYTLAFNQGLEEALLDRSKMMKAHGMGLDEIIKAKTRVRSFKPKP